MASIAAFFLFENLSSYNYSKHKRGFKNHEPFCVSAVVLDQHMRSDSVDNTAICSESREQVKECLKRLFYALEKRGNESKRDRIQVCE